MQKMACVGFLIFYICGLSCVLFSCEGTIVSPAGRSSVTFLSGSTGNLTWKFDDDVSALSSRLWYFTRSGCSGRELIVSISHDDNPRIRQNLLSGVDVVKPATIILKNVSQSYNGKYEFILVGSKLVLPVGVRVVIAKKPTVTLSCSSPVTLNEGDDVTCECRGEGGNPPADVTWYKDAKKIGETKKKTKTLSLSNVDKRASGTYKCVAKSFTLMVQKSMEIIVYSKASFEECSCIGKTKWHIVMVSSLSGIMIGILLSYIVFCFRRKFKSRKTQLDSEPETTQVDPTYQELDLTRMNTEDNYQSLRGNANDDDSTYTELNKTRDVENIYQSLT